MIFEHFALNVTDAPAATAWYVENLGLKVLKQQTESPFTAFLGDSTGRVFLEVYSNPAAAVTDFSKQHPLVFHWALVSEDPSSDLARLVAAGARVESDGVVADGSRLIMLRDPFGIPLQLCCRATRFPTG
ncbi:MAG TPA: VOC family protein [Opitutaceae bacterium]|nr:VOC family protein [Opitutaceae bacterium]